MSVFQSDPIVLGSSKPFATGDHRLCFKHPSDGSLCVKVNRQGKAQALKANAPLYKKFRSVDSFDDNKIEYRAFQQPAIRRNTPDIWRHIPRCYGWVETDIGPGLVTDFFGDDDQDAAAMTLEYYLQEFGKTPHLSIALEEFAIFLRRYLLLTKNLMPHNLLVLNSDYDNTSADLRLVLVDGFGLSTIFPLAKYVPLLAKRHVEKRLHWLSYRISWEVSDRKLSWLEAEKEFINGAENIHV